MKTQNFRVCGLGPRSGTLVKIWPLWKMNCLPLLYIMWHAPGPLGQRAPPTAITNTNLSDLSISASQADLTVWEEYVRVDRQMYLSV